MLSAITLTAVIMLPLEGADDREIPGVIVPIVRGGDGSFDPRGVMSDLIDEGYGFLPQDLVHLIDMRKMDSAPIDDEVASSLFYAVPLRAANEHKNCLRKRDEDVNWKPVPFNPHMEITGDYIMILATRRQED